MSDYKVRGQLARAKKAGLPATLTQEQWKRTLEYFDHKCAYCLVRRYVLIEHFIPIRKGGGTTANNCVPACWSCNARKDNSRLTFFDGGNEAKRVLERVRLYLESLEI